MAKHHVNPNTGNPGICKSAKGRCPFGSEDEHFSSPQEATQAAEKLMADQYATVNNAYRKKDSSALNGMNREMKKRIISEAAEGKNGLHPSVVAKAFSKDSDELIRKNVSEKFKSQKILREMSTDESARVRLAVAKATNNPEVLKAFANDPDIAVRKAAIANAKTPVKARKAALAALGAKKVSVSDDNKSLPKRPKKLEPSTPQKPKNNPSSEPLPGAFGSPEYAAARARLGGQESAIRADARRAETPKYDTRSDIRKIYKGDLTPSSEARLKYLDEQLQSPDPVIKKLATDTKNSLMNSRIGYWSIDEKLEKFDDDVNAVKESSRRVKK